MLKCIVSCYHYNFWKYLVLQYYLQGFDFESVHCPPSRRAPNNIIVHIELIKTTSLTILVAEECNILFVNYIHIYLYYRFLLSFKYINTEHIRYSTFYITIIKMYLTAPAHLSFCILQSGFGILQFIG